MNGVAERSGDWVGILVDAALGFLRVLGLLAPVEAMDSNTGAPKYSKAVRHTLPTMNRLHSVVGCRMIQWVNACLAEG